MPIPSRFAPQLFAFFMSMVMAFVMTAFVTWINTGMDNGYIGRWMHAFITAWPLALLCVLIFVNPVRALVAKLTGK